MTQDIRTNVDSYAAQGTKRWDAAIASRDLIYQVGMVHKVLLQIDGYRYVRKEELPQLSKLLADELADTLSMVLLIADEHGIDLEKAWRDMLESDKKKINSRTIFK